MKDEEVITDEEADSWGGHKTKLKALLKMVAHVHDLQGERHVEKRKKLSVKQENSDCFPHLLPPLLCGQPWSKC